MIYYCPNKTIPFIFLKAENIDEFESLEKLLYVKKNKTRDLFCVRFQYLLDLNAVFKLKPESDLDKKYLLSLFNHIKYLKSLSSQVKGSAFDYSKYISPASTIKLQEFQRIGADYIFSAKKCILADDVGLGKTIQTILAICRGIEEGLIKNSILIVAPASVKYQWKNEILDNIRLDLFPEFKSIVIVEGSKIERQVLYKLKKKIYIVNYEQFLFDFKELYLLSDSIDAVILDEASMIKNAQAQRSKKIKTILNDTQFKIQLTATPIENKLHDLYSLCQFLDPSIFTSYKYFTDQYCLFQEFRLGRSGPLIRRISGYRNLSNARIKIAGFYLRRTVEMVGVQLPKFIVQLRYVELLPEQRKLYDDIKNRAFLSKMKQIHLLHQICNDPETLDEVTIAKSAKIKELLNVLNECSTEKIIIFSFYRRFTNLLYQKLKEYNPLYIHGDVRPSDREKYKQMFNKIDKYRIMIMTKAGERGIDLPAASILVNMDLPENPSALKQRCGRPRRMSSKHESIRIINILAKDTIEEKTVQNIFRKVNLFTAFFAEDNPDLVGGSFYKGLSSKELVKLF